MSSDNQSPGKFRLPEPPDEIADFLRSRADELVDEEARATGLGDDFVDLARRVYRQESGRRGDVLSMSKRSSAGAIGPMQLTPDTAGDLGEDPYDFHSNIRGGVRYLANQYKTFRGDKTKAAAAYNAGPGAVRKYGGVPPYQETQDYVRKVNPSETQPADAGDPEIEDFLGRRQAQANPAQPTLAPAEEQRRKLLTGQITAFESLKQQGKLEEAKTIAADIKKRFGDIMETGESQGWPYVKPKAGSGFTAPGAPADKLPQRTPGVVEDVVNRIGRSIVSSAADIHTGISTMPADPESALGYQIGAEMAERRGETPAPPPNNPARIAQAMKESEALRERARAIPIDTSIERTYNPLKRGFYQATLPEAAGSMAIPMALGAVSGPLAPYMSGLVGATQNSGQVYTEAKAAGASDEDAQAAAGIAALIGTSEAAGLGKTLARLGISRPIAKRLGEIVEEYGQETGSNWLNDINAKYISKYDPNRNANFFSAENQGQGLVAAILAGGVQGLDIGGERLARLREERANRVGATPAPTTPEQAPPARAVSPIQRTATAPGQVAPTVEDAPAGPSPRPEDDRGLEIVRYVDQVAQIESAPISEDDREAAKDAARESYLAQRRSALPEDVRERLAEPSPFVPLSRAGLNTVRTGPTPDIGAIVTPPSSQELNPEAFGYIPQRKALPPATGEEIIPAPSTPSRAVREVISQPDPRFTPGVQSAQTQAIATPNLQEQQPAPEPTAKLTKAEEGEQKRKAAIVKGRELVEEARQQAEQAEAQGRLDDAHAALVRQNKALSDLRGLIPRKTRGDVIVRDDLGKQMQATQKKQGEIKTKIAEQRKAARQAKTVDPNAPTADVSRARAPLLEQVNTSPAVVPIDQLPSQTFTQRLQESERAAERQQRRESPEQQERRRREAKLNNTRLEERIRSLGGINPDVHEGELISALDRRRPGFINRRSGIKPDRLREMLKDEGYPVGDDLDSLFRAIDDDIAGKGIYPATRNRTEELANEEAEYYARQEEELRRQEEYNQRHETSDNSESLALPVLPRTAERPVRQADTPTGRGTSEDAAGRTVAGRRNAEQGSLRVEPATLDNIEDLRIRRAELDRLRYDRGGRLTGDLADEYRELGSRIAEFENRQAREARGGRPEVGPPPGGDERPFQPATTEDRRRAFEAVEARLGDEIERATDSLPQEDSELLERGVAAIDDLFEVINEDADVADLFRRTLEGDADAETELRNFADKQHGIDADTFDSIIDAGRAGREREQGRVRQIAATRRTTDQPEAVNARPGENRPTVEAAPQAQALSSEGHNLLSENPDELSVDELRQHRQDLDQLKADFIHGRVDLPEWAERQLQARIKQTSQVWDERRKKGEIEPKHQGRPQVESKPPNKVEGGRRLVEQAKKKEAEKAEETPTVTHSNPEIDRKPILAETNRGTVLVANPNNATGVSEVKNRSDEPTEYKFSSTQVDLPPAIADQIVAFGRRIPDADLAEDGRETEPHITVKYGLHGADPKFVRESLASEKPVTVKFGKVSLFENDEYDVVKVDVDSPDLHRLNKKVGESQPVTDTFPDYKPHATIAYVRKGLGKKYAGDTFLEGKTTTLDAVTFSGRDGEKVEIPLGKKETAPPPPGPTRPLVTAPLSKATIAERKRLVGKLMPFNIQGNKADLLAKGLGPVIERAAKGTKRTIDAFGGTGLYTHYLRSKGLGHEGDILNEFDPLRYITHKQLKENPERVAQEARRTLTEVRQLLAGVSEGERFGEKAEEKRRQVADYFQRRLNALVASGENVRQKARAGEPVKMQDTPETAGLYLVMQEQAFNSLPIQAEVTDDRVVEEQGRMFSAALKRPHFKLPGFVIVTDQNGKVGLFQGKERLFETPERAREAGQRMKGVEVRRGDGWELVRKEAGAGDLVPVDTSYLNKSSGEQTSNYSQATAEDAVPEIYMQKVRENLLPAWDRGAKLVVTNNWDKGVADYLRSLGFNVVKAVRQGASREDIRTGGAAELVAINFDKKSGEIFKRPAERESGPMASVQRQPRQTDTPEFKRWFGDSEVVDGDGKPLEVYHGSPRDFEIFKGDNWAGYFTENPNYASTFARTISADSSTGYGPTYPTYLSIKNPFYADDIVRDINDPIGDMSKLGSALGLTAQQVSDIAWTNPHYARTAQHRAGGPPYWAFFATKKAADILRSKGYDGLYAIEGGNGVWAALDSNQIKSATGNSGQFSPENPSILASRQRRGAPATQERSKYWDTPPVPRTPSGFLLQLTPEQKAEQFEYSRAEFRQHATRARVYANEQGAFTYAAVSNKVTEGDKGSSIPIAVDGISVPIKTARGMIRYLLDRLAEKQSPTRKEVYNNLAHSLEQAVRAAERKGDQAITIVSTEASLFDQKEGFRRSRRAVREVAAHEETHVWEANVGGEKGRGLFSDEVIKSDPDYEQHRQALINREYPANMTPAEVSAEAIAHAAAGQWRDLGYKSEAGALKYMARVFDRVYTEFGADALRSLRLRAPGAKGVREDVQARRTDAGMGRGPRPSATERTVAGREVRGTQTSLPGREGEGRRSGEGAGGEVQRTEPRGTALASVQRGNLPAGFSESPDQSGVRAGFVRVVGPNGKATIIASPKGYRSAPAAKPATERAQPPRQQSTTTRAQTPAGKRPTSEQQTLFEMPERERSVRDVRWYDYLQSPLSNLNFKGTYERLAGETGKEISEAFRQAQIAIARNQETRGREIAQLEKTLQGYKKQLRAEGKPGLANWLDTHVAALEDPDAAFRGLAGFLKAFQYNTKLRFNPRSIVVNWLQPLQTLWPHLTTAEFTKIMVEARQPSTRQRIAELAARESGGKVEDIDQKRRWWDPFGKVSETNRIMGHLAGELIADRLGLKGSAKARMAADWAKKTEFDNSRWDVPPLFRSRTAAVVGQFKPFVVKNLERLRADWKEAPEGSASGNLARRAKIITSQLALGGVRSLLLPGIKGIGGVLILGGLAKALTKGGMDDDDADKMAEAIYFGAPGLIEQDLSSSVMLLDSPFGSTPSEQVINFLGGPTLSLVVKAWSEGKTMATAKDSKEQSREEKIKASALRLGKAVSPYTKTAETAYSLATTHKAPKLKLGKEEKEMTTPEAVGYGLMGTPLRQTRYYEEQDAYDWQKRLLGKPTIDRLPGDTDRTYQMRSQRIEAWTEKFENELRRNPRFKSMKEPQQRQALQNLHSRITEQANQKLPNLTKLSAWDLIRSMQESEQQKPARDKRKLVVAPK